MKAILIVGKNDRCRKMLENYLSFEGYAEEATSDLTEALERTQKRTFDLVLWDARLPLRGQSMLRGELERTGQRTPFITLDSASVLKPFDPAFTVNCDECVIDPHDTRTLVNVVGRALRPQASQLQLAS